MRLSHLNGWRALEAVLRGGTLAAAAKELGVTTAAAGAQLRALEDRLGRRLFERAPSGLIPLPETMAERRALTSAFAGLAAVQGRLTGTDEANSVSLAVTQTFAETWLPIHMGTLFAMQDGVDLRLDTSWDVVDLGAGQHDFAIRFMDTPDPEYAEVPLLPSGVIPVCTEALAKRFSLSPGETEMRGVPLVHMDVPTSDPAWLDWAGWSKARGIALPDANAPKLAVSGSGLRLAKSGIGLVLGGMSEVLHAVASGELVMPFGAESGVAAGFQHRLIWLADRRLTPVQKRVRDWIAKSAEADRALMRSVFGI